MRFVGIDIGKAKCRVAIMDRGGIILEEFTFTNTDSVCLLRLGVRPW